MLVAICCLRIKCMNKWLLHQLADTMGIAIAPTFCFLSRYENDPATIDRFYSRPWIPDLLSSRMTPVFLQKGSQK